MILRNKRITKQANEIVLHVSYGLPDARRMAQVVFRQYHHDCDWYYKEALAMPFTENEIIEMFQSNPNCFGNYQEKWARPLAEWCLNAAIREKCIVKSAVNENIYFFTEKAIKKKRGRPVKSE